MKLGLMGFGRTGKLVASFLLQNDDVTLEWVVRSSRRMEHRSVAEFLGIRDREPGQIWSKDEFPAERLLDEHPVDAIIDFSSVNGIDWYGEAASRRGIAIVTAISTYPPEKIGLLQALARDTRVLWSPNITIGINFLMLASRVLKRIAPYTDVEIVEEHFKAKNETSGTAKRIAEYIDLPLDAIKSIRAGGIIGTHEVIFGFPFQTVRLRHESISREAFGNGALFAARNLAGKPAGLYSMEDLLLPYFMHIRDVPID